jgi:hypothetical protein
MNEVLLTVVVLIVFVSVIYAVERRVRAQGALFTGQPTSLMRVLAVAVGLLFMGLFVSELLSSSTFHIWFPILAIALISYGLGASHLLGWLQGRNQRNKDMPEPIISPAPSEEANPQSLLTLLLKNRLLRFGVTMVIVLAVSALALYGAIWAATHPNDPFALVYVVGLIAVFALGRVFHWFKFLRDLLK